MAIKSRGICDNENLERAIELRLEKVDEAELDEQWSFVGKKSNQHWLWLAIDHVTNKVSNKCKDGRIFYLGVYSAIRK